MAITTKEFKVLIETVGLKEALRQVQSLGDATEMSAKKANIYKRNMEGTGKESLNAGKSFAKQAQGLGGLVHVYATVAANVFALSSAFEVLKRSADLQILQQTSVTMSAHLGTNLMAVAGSLKEVTRGALGMREALQQANIAAAAGIDSKGLEQLTEIATKAAAMTGRNVPDAVNRLTQAVVKAEPELVDEFGIILRVGKATEDYAESLGKAADELTTAERSQAILNQVLERGGKITEGIQLDDTVNNFTKLQTSVVEFSQTVISLLSGPISSLAGILSNSFGLIAAGAIALVSTIGKKLFPIFQDLSASIQESAERTSIATGKQIVAQKRKADALAEEKIYLEATDKARAKIITKLLQQIGLEKQLQDVKDRAKKEGISYEEALGKELGDPKTALGKKAASVLKDVQDEEIESFKFGREKINRIHAASMDELVVNTKAGALKMESALDVSRATQRIALSFQIMTGKIVNSLQLVKLAIIESFSKGTELGLIGTFKDLPNIFSRAGQASELLGGSFSKVRGTMGAVSALAGGILTTIGKFGPYAALAVAAFEILKGIAVSFLTFIGGFSKEYDKSLKSLESLVESSKESVSISEQIAEKNKELADNLVDAEINAKRLANAFNESEANLEKMLDLAKKLRKERGFLDRIFGSDTTELAKGFTNSLETVANLVDTMDESVLKKAGLDKGIKIKITPEIAEELDSSHLGHLISNELENTVILRADNIHTVRDFAEAVRETNPSIKEFEDLISGVLGEAELYTKTQDENASATSRLTTALEESNKAYKSTLDTLNDSNLYVTKIKEFNTILDMLKSVSEKEISNFFEKNNELRAIGVHSQEQLNNKLKEYIELNRITVSGKNELAYAEANLKAVQDSISRGNIDAIDAAYSLQVQIIDLKREQANLDIEESKILLSNAKLKVQDLQIRALTSKISQAELNTALEQYKVLKKTLDLKVKTANLQAKTAKSALKDPELTKTKKRTEILLVQLKLDTVDAEGELARLKEKHKNIIPEEAIQNLELIGEKSEELFVKQQTNYDKNISALEEELRISLRSHQTKNDTKILEQLRLQIKQLQNKKDLDAEKHANNILKIQKDITKEQLKQLDVKSDLASIKIEIGTVGLEATQSKINKLIDSQLISRKQASDYARQLSSIEQKILDNGIKVSKIKEKQALDRASALSAAKTFRGTEEELLAIDKELLKAAQARAEILGLEVDKQLQIEESRRRQLEMDMGAADGFAFSTENMKLAGEFFAQEYRDSIKNGTTELQRYTTAMVDSLDNAIDDFTTKFRETGGDIGAALKAAGDAIINTLNDAAFEQAKQTLKKYGRKMLASIFGGNVSDYMSTEEKIAEFQRRTMVATEKLANKDLLGAGKELQTEDPMTDMMNTAKEGMSNIWKTITETTSNIWKSITETSSSIWSSVTEISGHIFQSLSSVLSSIGTNVGGSGSSFFGGIGNLFSGLFGGGSPGDVYGMGADLSAVFAKGGITATLEQRMPIPAYANGTITNGPELAMIGEGSNREAVVPLPDNRSIPVTFPEGAGEGDNITINVNVTGVQGTEQGLRRSSNQIALEVSRAVSKANRRIG